MKQKIDRYVVEKVLGKGAMGKVYLAFDPVIERHVAIKMILLRCLEDPEDRKAFQRRFAQEARIAGKLRHPGAVTVYDMGQHQEQPFIVMEYVDGQILSECLAQGPLSREDCLKVITGMADALAAAHALDIVHRDIKPQNVMLSHEVKILDFGIAKLAGKDFSAAGEFWGTPAYAAPEQITDRQADHRADIYAFGVLVHKLLTGQDAFTGGDIKQLFYQVLHGSPHLASPHKHLGFPHDKLHKVLRKAMARNIDERYQHINTLAKELQQLFPGTLTEEPASQTIRTGARQQLETTQTLPGETYRNSGPTHRERLQAQFQDALAEQNIIACRHLLRAMERKRLPMEMELAELEKLLAQQETAQQEKQQRLIHHKKKTFTQQLQAGDLKAATLLLESLQELDADVVAENQTLLMRQKDRQALTQKEQQQLGEALESGLLVGAQNHLRKLKKLGADTTDAEKKVAELERIQQKETRKMMGDITAARSRFKTANSCDSPQDAAEALESLKALGGQTSSEEATLAARAERTTQEHRQILAKLEQTLKEQIRACRWLQAEQTIEQLSKHEKQNSKILRRRTLLVKAREKHRKKALKKLERAFQQAIDGDDEHRTRELQLQLAKLDADSPRYLWLLRKASGKDPGPVPINWRQRIIVATLLAIAGWLVFWLWP